MLHVDKKKMDRTPIKHPQTSNFLMFFLEFQYARCGRSLSLIKTNIIKMANILKVNIMNENSSIFFFGNEKKLLLKS